MEKCFIALVTVGTLVLSASSVASANSDPHRVFFPASAFDIPARVCTFPVHVDVPTDKEYATVTTLPDGSTKYVITGAFIDFYGDFQLDARMLNVETGEIVKVESDHMQRDHLFDLIRSVSGRLMKDANLPPLPKQAAEQWMGRQVPTDALTFYSRALLYQDRGQRDQAVEMYQKALAVFPAYAEAQQALQRAKTS